MIDSMDSCYLCIWKSFTQLMSPRARLSSFKLPLCVDYSVGFSSDCTSLACPKKTYGADSRQTLFYYQTKQPASSSCYCSLDLKN